MRSYDYDVVVFLLRGQPFHKAHQKIISRALAFGKKVIVVLGSHQKARSTYNPWSSTEREAMIRLCFDGEDLDRMRFTAVRDYPYENEVWMSEVHTKVNEILDREFPINKGWSDYDYNSGLVQRSNLTIGLIGYEKDETSHYLNWFPCWDFIDTADFVKGIAATQIRNSFFMEKLDYTAMDDKFKTSKTLVKALAGAEKFEWRDNIPPPVVAYIEQHRISNPTWYDSLLSEYKSNLKKQVQKGDYPYPIIESTVDSVLIKNGHLLLVKRGEDPGKGQWALPGGYLGEYEEKFPAAVRELFEETSLNFFPDKPMTHKDKVTKSKEEIAKFFDESEEFGHPRRSTRGRVITKAFCFRLPSEGPFPFVQGRDDAVDAKWFSYSDIVQMEEQMFEDHLDICRHFFMRDKKRG